MYFTQLLISFILLFLFFSHMVISNFNTSIMSVVADNQILFETNPLINICSIKKLNLKVLFFNLYMYLSKYMGKRLQHF